MDSSEERYGAMHSDKEREPFVLSGRKSAIRPKGMVARYEGSPENDQVRNGDRETGSGR